jgi:hypothetical protein
MVRIVSGGQSGVDRAALDAALALGVNAGGWCPEGRLAEDGVIPDIYPLKELPMAGYRQRTKKNVIDSDGTLIIYFGFPTGGTELTISFCIREKQPYLLIDAEEVDTRRATARVLDFVSLHSINTLNVAGPRASGEPRGYGYTKEVIQSFLAGYKGRR